MKRILLLLTAFIFILSAFGCNKPNIASESIEPLVEMQEITPVGTVSLGEELSHFDGLLANNYINIDAIVEYSGKSYAVKVNARRTQKGYDVIAKIDGHGLVERLYYVDGRLVYGTNNGSGDALIYKQIASVGFVDFVNGLNEAINSSAEGRLIYHILKPVISKFDGFKNVDYKRDFTASLNGFLSLLKDYRSRSVYDFVLGGLMGVDLSDGEQTQAIEEDILSFCSGNPSVASFIDKIEAYINTKLSQEHRINIKEYLNSLQQVAGVTTAELVEMVRVNIPSVSDNLRAVESGETFYDYLRSYFRVISVNALTKNLFKTDKTFVEFIRQGIESSKQTELEYAINWVISNYFKVTNSGGEIVVEEHLQAFFDRQVVFEDVSTALTVLVDDMGRPTKISCSARCFFTETVANERVERDSEISFNAPINYTKSNVNFALPQEAIEGLN